MRFPKAEPKIVSLIHEIIAGLQTHQDLFPSPPVSAEELEKQFDTYLEAADTAIDKQAEAKHAVEEKNHALDAAVESARMILRYAENVTHSDDAALIKPRKVKQDILLWYQSNIAQKSCFTFCVINPSAGVPIGNPPASKLPARPAIWRPRVRAMAGSPSTGNSPTKAARRRPTRSSAGKAIPRLGWTQV
uniref:Uncharacterized protein n=1 Tax=Candidatus Kentrum sp. FM TaxID=2126340 RepID=A0A450S2T6_9GAMM|nr:MAG: hypothetical protein BECKFM1743A_GA0114220_100297 [Candidatus Kentron sp. FM]VFJ45960.1 MAG: hypothetical protein BECKFM1743C_GA0114222_100327 [Candidatus Kentron sp. FM]VFK07403.1 MAG: hypothetical protein BECKFM1743B_GA0114221_100407 [Candidatus Kentron sp. FM]